MAEKSEKSGEIKLYYWLTIIILFFFCLIIGTFSFQNYFSHQNEEISWLRSLYRSLQLFTLEGGDLSEPISWNLQLIRFTAPLITIMAVVAALFEMFKDQLNQFKISRMRNHVVIIGFGNKGKNVLEENLQKKEKILIIEKNPLNPNLASIRSQNFRWLQGDASNFDVLKKAGIEKAKSVFLLMGDDTIQVDTCLKIYDIIKKSKRNKENALSCIMHLHTSEFFNNVRAHSVVKNINDGLKLNVFNIYENSAREMFIMNPPDREGITKDSNNFIQIVILGFGKAGEALALETALTGHLLNGLNPKILVVDRAAKTLVSDFNKRYPSIKEYCEISELTMEADSPQLINELVSRIDIKYAMNSIVLCFDNKTQNLLLGLQFENLKLTTNHIIPEIFIRTTDNESLATVSEFLIPYGVYSKVCSSKIILEGELDILAKAVHDNYLKKRETESDFGKKSNDVKWEFLTQEFQDSNRKAADHIGVKIRGIGCDIVIKDDQREETTFTDEELGKLAELEHKRWSAERSLAGWTYGKVKNDKIRKTPYLVDWNKLPEYIKKYDYEAVESIPDVLKKVGLKVVRRIK